MIVLLITLIATLANAQSDYFGRAIGTSSSWKLVDETNSHHLEVYFDPMPGYTNFQANIDVRSKDGSFLSVAQTTNLTSILSKLQGSAGVTKLTAGQGFKYCDFLKGTQFQQLPETQYVALLEKVLANHEKLILFGQVYADSNGANGIHDIHENTMAGYGDGGFIGVDGSGNYVGFFAYFQDQGLKC